MTVAESLIAPPPSPTPEVDWLHNGDRMTQAEFHRAYERMPSGFRAELIGGLVYVPSPLRIGHGEPHSEINGVLWLYKASTPGVQLADNATVILDEQAEPQPDLLLRIRPDHGGRSTTTADDYVAGPPELVVEVAHSSRAIDLHAKRVDYARSGVPEYLVHLVGAGQVRWFDLATDRERLPDSDGVIRSAQFPGLWIDVVALVAGNSTGLIAVLQQGLATPEHAAFVAKLAAAGR